MLTKGIILERVINSNTYLVRIPYLESAGNYKNMIFEATLSHEPALTESYVKDDVVIIGFEDHHPDKPIIIGKLFTSNTKASGHASIESINIEKEAQLPQNTKVGDIEVYSALSDLKRLSSNNKDEINEVRQNGGGGGTPTVKYLGTTSTVSLTPISSESLSGYGTVYLHKVSKTGYFPDLNGIPETYTPSSHVHGEISNDGKIGATPITTNIDCVVVTDNNAKLQRVTMQSLASKLSVPSISASTATVSGASNLGSIVINGATYNVSSGGSGGSYVPYYGATDDVILGNHKLSCKEAVVDKITFDGGNSWAELELDSSSNLHLKSYDDNELLSGDIKFPNNITATVATSDLLKPTLIGQTLIADNAGYNTAVFDINVNDMNGIYVFTYGNCMIPLVAYGLTSETEYKTSACLVDGSGNYKVKVLTYKYASALGKMYIYSKENYMPQGWGAALYKIKLY